LVFAARFTVLFANDAGSQIERLILGSFRYYADNRRLFEWMNDPRYVDIFQQWIDYSRPFQLILNDLFQHRGIGPEGGLHAQLQALTSRGFEVLQGDQEVASLLDGLVGVLQRSNGWTSTGAFVTPENTPENSPTRRDPGGGGMAGGGAAEGSAVA
jgi:hypothetical protein